MGVSVQTGGKQNKKPLDAELNLIPFIDLLICCICFLLITAVWTELAHIEVQQKATGRAAETTALPRDARVAVLVSSDGYTLVVGSQRQVIALKGVAYDTDKLASALKTVRARIPGKSDITVAAEDGISYRHLVRTLDIARQAHFVQIAVKDAAAFL